jgi:hypothetical protein
MEVFCFVRRLSPATGGRTATDFLLRFTFCGRRCCARFAEFDVVGLGFFAACGRVGAIAVEELLDHFVVKDVGIAVVFFCVGVDFASCVVSLDLGNQIFAFSRDYADALGVASAPHELTSSAVLEEAEYEVCVNENMELVESIRSHEVVFGERNQEMLVLFAEGAID